MRYIIFILCLCCISLPLQAQEAAAIRVLTIDGAISPAYADYLHYELERAGNDDAQVVLVELNTPGGLLTSTRKMVSDIINAPVPVIVYVTPSGAHAASAGTFILMAGHVAAMDVGTNVGAATPVQLGGRVGTQLAPPSSSKDEDGLKDIIKGFQDPNSEALRQKSLEDTTALIRGIAELRGRNAEWAEKAVTEAQSITAREALDKNVIDLVAPSRQALLASLDGREITLKSGKKVVLQTQQARIEEVEPGILTKFLAFISDPNVAAILMMIGVYGLILEFYSPGTMIPGTIGAICILLGLYAMSILPINGLGGMLIAVGFLFAVAETFLPSFGILGFGALVAMGIGLFILFDADAMPGMYLHWQVIGGILASMLVLMGLAFTMFVKSALDRERSTGAESMVGATAKVMEWHNHEGFVFIQGERWQAFSPSKEQDFKTGDKVLISSVEDLKLKVRSV